MLSRAVPNYENLNILWASLLVEELLRNGVDYFCLSPGSRSTPLAVAAARHPNAVKRIIHDERGAAFHALGYARASGKPAVLICTSGTAVANYLPAVIEAAVDRVPLLVISADRPPELQETGANQTIRQTHLFGDYTKWYGELPCADTAIPARMVLTTVDQAVYRAKSVPSGPVHLNCAFREPLAPEKKPIDAEYTTDLRAWFADTTPWTQYQAPVRPLDKAALNRISTMLQGTTRGFIAVGRLHTAAERTAVAHLLQRLQWPVYADIASGLRLTAIDAPLIPYADQLYRSPELQSLGQPEIVLHIGGQCVSKRYLQFVETLPATTQYLLVDTHPCRDDPDHRVSYRLEADIEPFCRALGAMVGHLEPRELYTWTQVLLDQSALVEHALAEFMAPPDLNEIAVARLLADHIPENHGLWLSNSMPVRDMDMYGKPQTRAVRVGANRGASGIDGTVASASGFAAGLQQPVTLLIGDLALLHDLNSLLLAQAERMTIVVINNDGGGIFSFLPIAGYEDVFEDYFATPHQLSFQSAATLFSLHYSAPQTRQEFIAAYQKALTSSRSTLIEVSTDRQDNLACHRRLQGMIAAHLNLS
ncbi:MAG: 2-succinyl-5-enolpyruvyl-6-hydroxy-3-cyclohexene-1-carboxylic-acid synthase [Candidatus Competibacteraceae bacterium]|nr:2-succinyl-5-enolpyruvyl-6-hydroxy-3-cyclohexene-1-carboxylic-acid synthase [Candidatus Competibacteraceae bacterium]